MPRKTRIGVEPEYVVLVDSDQVRLEARLRYTVRGAKVFAVEIAMPDWQIDEVGPESVVAIDGVPTGAPGPVLSLPLVSPTIGQFEIRLKAHRPLPADGEVAFLGPSATAGQRAGCGGGSGASRPTTSRSCPTARPPPDCCGSRWPCRWNFPRGSRNRCSTAAMPPRPCSRPSCAAIGRRSPPALPAA